jgi:hypothetical protein
VPKSNRDWGAQELRRHLDGFLAGKEPMADFQREFMGQYLRLTPGALPEPERPLWRSVYELLTRAAPDPIDPSARSQGVIGEAELRARLRDL